MAANDFGTYLRRMREARGLSLIQLADRSGIDKSRLSKLERGELPPPSRGDSRDTVIRLAQALEDDPMRLLELSGHEPRSDERTVRSRPPFRELILTEKTLTSKQKAALLGVYDVITGGAPAVDVEPS